MIFNVKMLIAGAGFVALLLAGLTIQTMRATKYADLSSELQEKITQINRANLLTESIYHYNARIYRETSEQVGELNRVPDLDDPLPSDLRRLLERVQQNP